MENNILINAEPVKKRSGLKKWLRRLFLYGLLFLVCYVLIGYYFNYSQGYRAGKLIKFSQKGYIFKTWEGQIYMGTITPDEAAGIASKYWYFSVDRGKDNIVRKLEEAMLSKHDVRLHYKEKLVLFLWRGDTKYFVDSVALVQ